MKNRIVILMFLLLCFVVSAWTQDIENTAKIEKHTLKEFNTEYEGSLKIDKETQKIRINFDENIIVKSKEPIEIITQLINEKGDKYCLDKIENIRITSVIKTPVDRCIYFEQLLNNIPVYAAEGSISVSDNDNVINYVLTDFRDVGKYKNVVKEPALSSEEALAIAYNHLKIQRNDVNDKPSLELVYFESVEKGLQLAWKLNFFSHKPYGDWQVFVSANDKNIIQIEDISCSVNGTGMVYDPNPLTSKGNCVTYGSNGFVDNNKADNTTLTNARISIILRDIEYSNGKYKLKGPYCTVDDNLDLPYEIMPEPTTPNGFNFTRGQKQFDAVMCYYHVDKANRRIEELGYNNATLKQIKIDPHSDSVRNNARYSSSRHSIMMGISTSPNHAYTAEDGDAIWHEFGHAMHYKIGAGLTGTSIACKSLKEGCSDYWTSSYKRSILGNSCNNRYAIADWCAHGPMRYNNLDLTYDSYEPNGNIYANGQIWCSIMMKIWEDLGRDVTDNLFLKAHTLWGTSTSIQDAAHIIIEADKQLYNKAHYCILLKHFENAKLVNRNQYPDYVYDFSGWYGNFIHTVNGCNVHVYDVSFWPWGKLTVNATTLVTLDAPFEIQSGAELEINIVP